MKAGDRRSGSAAAWHGLPARTYNAGEALVVPAETVHAVRNVGEGNGAELATFVIEKGKPFIVLADD